jgi:glycerol kinase
MTGLKLDTTPDDIIRAGFESMVFQTYDSLQAIGERPKTISVDGGGAISEYMCQTLANLTETDIVRPSNPQITSLGTAQTAVLGLGEELADWFSSDDANATVFRPENDDGYAVEGYHVWSSLVSRILS